MSATIENNTSITTGGARHRHPGQWRACLSHDNRQHRSIDDNTTAIDVNSGSAAIAGNDVDDNTTTASSDQPGAGTAFTANTVSGNGTGISLDGAGPTGITINPTDRREQRCCGDLSLPGRRRRFTVSQNLLSNNAVGVWV